MKDSVNWMFHMDTLCSSPGLRWQFYTIIPHEFQLLTSPLFLAHTRQLAQSTPFFWHRNTKMHNLVYRLHQFHIPCPNHIWKSDKEGYCHFSTHRSRSISIKVKNGKDVMSVRFYLLSRMVVLCYGTVLFHKFYIELRNSNDNESKVPWGTKSGLLSRISYSANQRHL